MQDMGITSVWVYTAIGIYSLIQPTQSVKTQHPHHQVSTL